MKRKLIVLLMLCLVSGGWAATAETPGRDGRTLGFYGRVNHWMDSRSELRKELRLMEKCGVEGYLIEMAGWARMTAWEEPWLHRTEREYRFLLRQCRRRGLWLFVSIVNDNMGLKKYNDPGVSLEEVFQQASELIEIVRRYGPANVMVQPVAEVRTEAGARFENRCKERLQGFFLVHNGGWGFPHSRPEGFDARAVHPPHEHFPVPDDAFVVSDHGHLIPRLTTDKTITGEADRKILTDWLLRLRSQGVPLVGYYAFQREQMDETAIRTVAEVLGAGSTYSTATQP